MVCFLVQWGNISTFSFSKAFEDESASLSLSVGSECFILFFRFHLVIEKNFLYCFIFSPGAVFINGFNLMRPTFFLIVSKVFLQLLHFLKHAVLSPNVFHWYFYSSQIIQGINLDIFFRQSKIKLRFVFSHASWLHEFFISVLACFCNLNIVIFVLTFISFLVPVSKILWNNRGSQHKSKYMYKHKCYNWNISNCKADLHVVENSFLLYNFFWCTLIDASKNFDCLY